MRFARMKTKIIQVGTGLVIDENTLVWVEDATNLPTPHQVFVQPVFGWKNGIDQSGEFSICTDKADIEPVDEWNDETVSILTDHRIQYNFENVESVVNFLKKEKFGISHKVGKNIKGDELIQNNSSTFQEALLCLIHNGWKEHQAIKDLLQITDGIDAPDWILVSDSVQIC